MEGFVGYLVRGDDCPYGSGELSLSFDPGDYNVTFQTFSLELFLVDRHRPVKNC